MASSASVLRLDGKPPIRRKRTGCFTCRKRRKKCDEAKPLCENCRRTGVICEGYPSETIWRGGCLRARSSSGTPRPPKSQTPLPQVQLAAAPQISQIIEEPILSWDDGGLFADDMDLMFESLDPSQVAPTTPPAAYHPTFLSPSIYRQQRAPSIPMELPFLINGIETRTEQRLFVHFTQRVSTLLTLCTDDKSNPFVSIVVPFAIKDPTIMQSLLCMAVSHLINLKGPDAELLAEKQRLHSVAVRTQTQRFEALDARNSAPSPREVEAILTSSLLLCLYEICEGSADGGWHLHLNSARNLIRKTAAMGPSNGNNIDMSSSISVAAGALPQINRFLLEFFIYHDTLATVTDLSQPALEPQVYRRSVNALTAGSGEAYLVGVHDGLFDIMAPISSLRAQADLSPLDVDGSVVCEAVAIWQALAEWHPPPSANPEVALIGSLYQWALFTWLYSVIYPDEITNSKVQLAVKNGLGSMQQIQPSSGAMSCLLFPLFILGSAAVDPGDRAAISIQFERLRAWSRLNNITVAHEVVKTLWSKYDRGEPKSWDWVKELEARGLSLLVT